MAKSIRSKWKRKCRAIKRERYAVKELSRLKKMLGVDDGEKVQESEVMESDQVIFLDANKMKKSSKEKLKAVEEDVEMSSDDEKVEVTGKEGKLRVFSSKTLKDQDGHYPVWLHKRKIMKMKRSEQKNSKKRSKRRRHNIIVNKIDAKNIKIDDIIDLLLTPEKIDQIANQIAEKAIQKINNYNSTFVFRNELANNMTSIKNIEPEAQIKDDGGDEEIAIRDRGVETDYSYKESSVGASSEENQHLIKRLPNNGKSRNKNLSKQSDSRFDDNENSEYERINNNSDNNGNEFVRRTPRNKNNNSNILKINDSEMSVYENSTSYEEFHELMGKVINKKKKNSFKN